MQLFEGIVDDPLCCFSPQLPGPQYALANNSHFDFLALVDRPGEQAAAADKLAAFLVDGRPQAELRVFWVPVPVPLELFPRLFRIRGASGMYLLTSGSQYSAQRLSRSSGPGA